MDILTILNANLRRRKGTFLSIVILMLICSMALTLILSTEKSCSETFDELYKSADCGNITVQLRDESFTDEMRRALDEHPLVERYRADPAIVVDYSSVNEWSTGNTWYFVRLWEGLRLVNRDLSGYESELPKLSKGEIYVSYGTKDALKCNVGDTLTAKTIGGSYEFTIKGFVTEPTLGASNMGWKRQFISDEDFETMFTDAQAQNSDTEWGTGYMVDVYKKSDCTLSDGKFRRQVNLDTGLISNAWGSLTAEQSKHYTNIYPDIIMGIMLAFILILVIVVLIVMGHSISTSIQMDQTDLGILKAQGFTSGRIRLAFLLQYMLAQSIGTVIGVAAAVPLIGVMTSFFDQISGYITTTELALGKTALYLLAVFAVSALFIMLVTRRIGKISPIRAISGGRSEIYFDSRLTVPIRAGALSATLALRQFTSAKRRYIASIVIAAVLVFFMLMVNAIGDSIYSKSAVEMMGGEFADMWMNWSENYGKADIDRMVEIAEQYTKVRARYFNRNQYISFDGDQLHCQVSPYPEDLCIIKGRAPIYDNEIALTEIVAEEYGFGIGDKVELAKNSRKEEFIVSGFFNSLNETGETIAISLGGGERLGIKGINPAGGLNLEDASKCEEIKAALVAEFGDDMSISIYDQEEDEAAMDLYDTAVLAMKVVIYSFSLVFALVAVSMVSSKAFSQEKTDIGIFKSQGFTSGKLRLQFAVRFLIVSILGSVIGTAAGLMFINSLLSVLLKGIGISNFHANFTTLGVMIPVGVICVCFFVFALLVSRRIKRVGIRQLVTE